MVKPWLSLTHAKLDQLLDKSGDRTLLLVSEGVP